jgi:hypothetical protein
MSNPPNVQLPLSNIINVTILPTAQSLQTVNINTAALFTIEQPSWINTQAFAIYTDASGVATDFGSDSDSFAIATAFFAQQPNPIGTSGYLVIVPRVESMGPVYESVKDAIIRSKDLVYYFGILVDSEYHSDGATFATLTAYVQTLSKMFFYCSSYTADFQSGGLLDLVRTSSETNTRCMYYHDGTAIDTPAFAAAYASRGLSTNFSGNNTTQTMNLKQLATFSPDQTLTETLYTEAQTAGVDIYPSNAGVPGLLTSGTNGWFDEIYNQFWFQFALEVAGFNYLATTQTKIPQTEQGMEGLKNAYRQICIQAISNGFVAPGSWNTSTVFGDPAALIRNIADIGYYVYSQPITQQLQADRAAREAPLVQIAIKAAGAINSSDVIVNVNL